MFEVVGESLWRPYCLKLRYSWLWHSGLAPQRWGRSPRSYQTIELDGECTAADSNRPIETDSAIATDSIQPPMPIPMLPTIHSAASKLQSNTVWTPQIRTRPSGLLHHLPDPTGSSVDVFSPYCFAPRIPHAAPDAPSQHHVRVARAVPHRGHGSEVAFRHECRLEVSRLKPAARR